MNVAKELARLSRPTRIKIAPRRFKESYVNDVLKARTNALYVEIGVRRGDSFRTAKASRKVGIDPQIDQRFYPLRKGEEVFEMESDDFFRDLAREVLPPKAVDVALVDGLHQFEQVVRDLTNLESYMKPDGLIVLDDINPRTADRASDTPTGRPWNGDVWKLGPFLQAERPDLTFVTVDADEGVGLVAGFGRRTDVPGPADVTAYKKLTYPQLDGNRATYLNLVERAKVQQLLSDL